MKDRHDAVKPMGMAGVGAPATCSAMPTSQAYAFGATHADVRRWLITNGSGRPTGPSGGRSG